MQLGQAIAQIRKERGLTQEAFAKELGVTASTINRWEHGKAKPNLTAMKNLKQFCEKHKLQYESIEIEWLNAQNEM